MQVSAGGLVSALMGVSNFKTCWVGWPGACCSCWHHHDHMPQAVLALLAGCNHSLLSPNSGH